MSGNADLTVKQERFLTAYLAAGNVAVAARTCSINEATGYRWLKLEHVQQALRRAQRQLFESELFELRRLISKAIRTLERNMEDRIGVQPSVQVSAAKIVLDTVLNLHQAESLEQRIDDLEQQVKERLEL